MYPPFYRSNFPREEAKSGALPEATTGFEHRGPIREDAAYQASETGLYPGQQTKIWGQQLLLMHHNLSLRDTVAWIGHYHAHQPIPRASRQNFMHGIRIEYEHQLGKNAARAYREAAIAPIQQDDWKLWLRHDQPGWVSALIKACEKLDESASTRPTLKQNARTLMVEAELNGQRVIIKRHRASTARRQVKEGLHGSRGRKAWQAAHALEAAGVPTPRPVAALEKRKGLGVMESYFIYESLSDVQSARAWIKPWLHQQIPSTRNQVSHHLQAMLEGLYNARIYHPDTKTGNLLVQHAVDDSQRSFYWIDLDGIRVGYTPGFYGVLRNLIQLNGSLGRKLPASERIAFLHRLAQRFSFLTQGWVPGYIERVTRKRLERELRRECGH